MFEVDEHAPDPDVEQDDEFEFEHLPEEGSAESHIDDPIRMYLMQMGEIPMLSRPDEISSARQIEETRTRFRHLLLGNDFVLHAAVELLEKVQRRAAARPHDRNLGHQHGREETHAQAARAESGHDQAPAAAEPGRLPHRRSTSKLPQAEKHAAWRRLVVRRNKIVRLVEELNLRLGKLMPIMQQLHKISERMVTIKQQLAEPEKLISEQAARASCCRSCAT